MRDARFIGKLLLVCAAWLLLFSPRLLPGITPRTLAWVAISAVLFWPLLFRRWSMWLVVVAVAIVGALDISYVHYFRALTDEFFLATVLRTTREEVAEFTQTLPVWPIVGAAAWLCWCAATGVFLQRNAPAVLARTRLLRWSWTPAVAVWLVLVLIHALDHGRWRLEVRDKTASVYPLHLAWAAVKQSALGDAVFYQPVLPTYAPAAVRIDTLVAVIGESATAQRWSLLGYATNPTNEPLRALTGSISAMTLAQDFKTAGALPYVLAGRSTAENVARMSPSFLDVARLAGYKVFVFDNSRSSVNGDFFGRVLRRSTAVYQKIGNGGGYDDVLTQPLARALGDPAPRKLIVLHTFGSHQIVHNRYPPEYAKFDDPYDNSILYTSELLTEWSTMIKQASAGSAMLVYTSDHGLALPPCSDGYTHGRSLSSLEVPFFLWGNASAHAQLPQLFTLTGAHTNALFGERIVEALGYARMLATGEWPTSTNPRFEGRAWDALRKLDACTLK